MAKTKKKRVKGVDPNLYIVAGVFVGLALGFVISNVPAGLFGGIAIGVLLYANDKYKKGEK